MTNEYDRALDAARPLIAAAARADLAVSTPCDGWDLAALLRHVIGQNDGFAAAVATGDAPLDAYDGPAISGATVLADWDASVARLRAAFAEASPEGVVHLVEIGDVTVAQAQRMQLLDTVVHAWDLATALGLEHRPDDDLVAIVHADARLIADVALPQLFAPALAVEGGDQWRDALRLLGRRPI